MLLDEEIRKFLTGTVSIGIASRNAELVPSVARAKGCTVTVGASQKVRVLISAAHAGQLLDDVRSSGMISATFSVPNTHRTMQLKGSDARMTELQPGDRDLMDAYVVAFAEAIGPLGFSREMVQAYFASPPDEVAIEFTPSDAFQQTPGPSAGARLP